MGEENSEGEGDQLKSENNPSKTTGRANIEARQINDEESGKITEIRGSIFIEREGWHRPDVDKEESQFCEVIEAAIKFMYSKGPSEA